VQQGDIGTVWRTPVDPETALFLGFARVLAGPAAHRGAAAAGLKAPPAVVAVRRSALEVTPEGVAGSLPGVVVAARATPEQIRLVVQVDGVGEVDAVASFGRVVGPGARVGLSVDATRLAPVGPAAG
ncbi:MAG: ABC transporter ATP-binding protein, partial [Nocardioides sp.]|nr:ABC transporter ATP-binding protein [Nocardioides sp.]